MKQHTLVRLREKLYASDSRFLFLLLTNAWFRWVFLFCLGIFVGTPLATVKVIRTTPVARLPEIHISALDWLQAEALARTARRAVEEAEPELAFASWRSAIGNNPGRKDFNRQYLEALNTLDVRRVHWKDTLQTSQWLLHLSSTNRSDLELVCRTLERYDFHSQALRYVENSFGTRSKGLQRSYLRSLFRCGQDKAFDQAWTASSNEIKDEAILQLYRTAYEAAREPNNTDQDRLVRIRQEGTSIGSEELSNRLLLYVFHHREDRTNFEKVWNALRKEFRDKPSDHFLYWDLLQKLGYTEQAVAQANEFTLPPRSTFQVVEIADAFARLGLTATALTYLKNYSGVYGLNEQQFYAQASLLIDQEQWTNLQRLAKEIRINHATSNALQSYSHYIDGLGAFHQDRQKEAKVAFQKIKDLPLGGSNLALHIGSNLWDLGFPQEAYDALSPNRANYTNNPAFWHLMLEITSSLRLGSQMLVAAENLHRLSPENLQAQTNYASLLISIRTQIERATTLTFDGLSRDPENPVLKTNYAGRTTEAARYLQSVDQTHFDSQQRHGFAFAWLTVYHLQNDPEKALALAKHIIPALLLPGDRMYFETIQAWAKERKSTKLVGTTTVKELIH